MWSERFVPSGHFGIDWGKAAALGSVLRTRPNTACCLKPWEGSSPRFLFHGWALHFLRGSPLCFLFYSLGQNWGFVLGRGIDPLCGPWPARQGVLLTLQIYVLLSPCLEWEHLCATFALWHSSQHCGYHNWNLSSVLLGKSYCARSCAAAVGVDTTDGIPWEHTSCCRAGLPAEAGKDKCQVLGTRGFLSSEWIIFHELLLECSSLSNDLLPQ